jgi:cytochrome o ubiquinol oxidase subunit 2
VSFTLTSASVMNTFFVPQLGSMIYTMNGMATRLHLKADRLGDYLGISGHYSGDGYSHMTFRARAIEPSSFEAWGTRHSADAPPLDRGSYVQLARQSINEPVRAFRLADPRLFAAILSQELPPSAGPKLGQPAPSVSHRPGK